VIRPVSLLLLALALVPALPVRAQRGPEARAPLETFVMQVSHLWSEGDAGGLMELAPDDGQVVLDTGSGTQAVNGRHAAAALRALFSERESVSARPVRVTLAGGSPPRGFGEVAWTYRTRGAPGAQTRTVYVGAVWEGTAWKLRELRILP
jgi:hypothetical protein